MPPRHRITGKTLAGFTDFAPKHRVTGKTPAALTDIPNPPLLKATPKVKAAPPPKAVAAPKHVQEVKVTRLTKITVEHEGRAPEVYYTKSSHETIPP